jgi:hypothetical protein
MANAVGGMLEKWGMPVSPAKYFQIDDLSGATGVSPVAPCLRLFLNLINKKGSTFVRAGQRRVEVNFRD